MYERLRVKVARDPSLHERATFHTLPLLYLRSLKNGMLRVFVRISPIMWSFFQIGCKYSTI